MNLRYEILAYAAKNPGSVAHDIADALELDRNTRSNLRTPRPPRSG